MADPKGRAILISVHLGNIVKQSDCDGIVNSANRNLRAGSGVCGAIHRAAGPELEEFSHKLAPLETGDAVATPGFRLGNRVIIHTKGPKYHFDPEPAKYLAMAIRNALLVADSEQVSRLAVPAISMGVYAYPPEEAVPILVQAALDTGKELQCVEEIRFVVIDEFLLRLFDAQISQLNPTQAEPGHGN